jgi:hypothetical protein
MLSTSSFLKELSKRYLADYELSMWFIQQGLDCKLMHALNAHSNLCSAYQRWLDLVLASNYEKVYRIMHASQSVCKLIILLQESMVTLMWIKSFQKEQEKI